MAVDIAGLIRKGGVFYSVEGETPEVIYRQVTDNMDLPADLSKETVYNALCAREKIMSTAVGNGIALPHARASIIKDESEQRIAVVYLKKPIDMKSPDGIKVYVMFVLLTQNPQTHLQILSTLAGLFQNPKFRTLLEIHPSAEELAEEINNFL